VSSVLADGAVIVVHVASLAPITASTPANLAELAQAIVGQTVDADLPASRGHAAVAPEMQARRSGDDFDADCRCHVAPFGVGRVFGPPRAARVPMP
jgi:hypothetical protein